MHQIGSLFMLTLIIISICECNKKALKHLLKLKKNNLKLFPIENIIYHLMSLNTTITSIVVKIDQI